MYEYQRVINEATVGGGLGVVYLNKQSYELQSLPVIDLMRYIQAFFDGSCEPVNPGGTAKWGFAILEDDEMIHGEGGYIGKGDGMTSNVAEYHGAIECLKFLNNNHKDDLVEVFGDSKMVVLMIAGAWGKENPHKKYPHLLSLLLEGRELLSKLDNVTISWIPREQNQIADYFSKQ